MPKEPSTVGAELAINMADSVAEAFVSDPDAETTLREQIHAQGIDIPITQAEREALGPDSDPKDWLRHFFTVARNDVRHSYRGIYEFLAPEHSPADILTIAKRSRQLSRDLGGVNTMP